MDDISGVASEVGRYLLPHVVAEETHESCEGGVLEEGHEVVPSVHYDVLAFNHDALEGDSLGHGQKADENDCDVNSFHI